VLRSKARARERERERERKRGGRERRTKREQMRESGNDKGAGNWGSYPSSSVLFALVTAYGMRTVSLLLRHPGRFPFSLSPSSSALPSTHPFQLNSPLLDLSPSRSPCRLFTLLIPQHPPRNNDVGPCFSCFFLSFSFSFSLFLSLSLSFSLPF